jgi:dGTP triphosphohydrolase
MIKSTDIRLKDSKAIPALDVQQLVFNVIGFFKDMLIRNRELKDFIFSKLYRLYQVVTMQIKAEHPITDLINTYLSESLILRDHVQYWI